MIFLKSDQMEVHKVFWPALSVTIITFSETYIATCAKIFLYQLSVLLIPSFHFSSSLSLWTIRIKGLTLNKKM
ncbi:hypothetical protein C1646_709464 [Rhizophagus diaphanus]|nr:hypothetical protein C1646_709464 [Rhizophagus diaphanus] [Rhizophagus sp. MUCL 43196]